MEKRNRHDATPADSSSAALDRLAAAYFARRRAGQAITVDAFAAEHPEHADEIRALFPALELLEAVPNGDATPPVDAHVTAPAIDRLGDYRIVREIGRGGMGVVFEAVEETLNRQVAVKILPPQFQLDASLLERFAREAKAAAALQHPNIVPVYGLGESDGVHFFAMQFIDGLTLDRVIARVGEWGSHPGADSRASRPLVDWVHSPPNGPAADPPSSSHRDAASPYGQTAYFRSAARVMCDAAGAVAYAHARGVQHRDLKPGNLMIDARGKV